MTIRPRPSRRLQVEELEIRLTPSTATSTNWSGYAVQAPAGAVSGVAGTWVVPTSSGTGTAYSSTWVGIDGYNSSTVEQIGTDSDVVNGKAVYYAWYEMYPSNSVNLKLAVQPGDTITARVSYSAGNFTLQITDAPRSGAVPESFTTTLSDPTAQRSSAEWIEEAPSSYSGVLPLANFGSATISGATATIGGTTGAIDGSALKNSQVEQINMVSQRGTTEAATATLTDSGSPAASTFTVSYVPSSSTPTPPSRGHGGGGFGFRQTDLATTQSSALPSDVLPRLASPAPAATQALVAAPSAPGASSTLPASFPLTGPIPPRAVAETHFSAPGAEEQIFASPPGAEASATPPALPQDSSSIPPEETDATSSLSDVCFLEGGWAVETSENAAASLVAAEETAMNIESRVDLLFTLGLGALVGAMNEKSSRRSSQMRLG